MSKFNNILLTYNESHSNSQGIANQIVSDHSQFYNFSKISESKLEKHELNSIDLIITIGGDGTILRAANKVSELTIPILGINTGRVGFMSELESDNFKKDIKSYLDGEARIEMRAMLEANIKNLEESLNDKIGLRTYIKNKKNNSGTIYFEYKDLDQLNRLIETIKNNY